MLEWFMIGGGVPMEKSMINSFDFFNSLLGSGSNSTSNKTKRRRGRICRIEELENREMLSVTIGDFNVLREQYSELTLRDDFDSYNFIEIEAHELTSDKLRLAITTAGTTEKDDIIVVRTTTTQNTITLGGTELAININASQFGSVSIVSLGTDTLTIDAQNGSRGFNIGVGSMVALAGVTITNGNNAKGGGIINSGVLTVVESTITGNTAGSSGGGIYNNVGSKVSMYGCTITVNSSLGSLLTGGGGIYNDGIFATTNCVIVANSACFIGGGILNLGSFTITNCLLAANSGGLQGGAIDNDTGAMIITNSTIAGNTAKSGGGIYTTYQAALTINNTIVAKNFTEDIYNYTNVFGLIFSSDNLFGNNNLIGNGVGLTALINNINGIGNIFGVDPMFVDAAQGDYRLADGSPAIDKGGNQYVPPGLTHDLAGNRRIINGKVDIGAYEGGFESLPPAIPIDLRSIDKTTDSVTLEWDAVDNATSYEIQYRKSGDEGWTNVPVEGTSTTISSLAANTVYEFQVLAVNTDGKSDWSKSISVTTDRIKLAAPTNLTVDECTTTTLTISWTGVENAEGYGIQWATDEDFDYITGTGQSNATFFEITDLSASTIYYVRVMATTKAEGFENSEWSQPKIFTTAEPEYVPLAPPDNLAVSDKTTDSITLKWDAVDNATGYEVQYRKTGDEDGTVVPVSGTSTTVTDLDDDTVYEFQVRAVNAISESEWSVSIFETTDAIPPEPLETPMGLRVIGKTSGTITLSWNSVSGATGYEVRYRDNDGLWKMEDVVVTGTSAVVSNLVSETLYEFQVRAKKDGSCSDWSESVFEITSATIPGDLHDSDKTTDSVTLNWNIIPGATSYEIRYRIVSASGSTQWSADNVTTTDTTVTITGLDPDTTYEFQMRSRGTGSANSGWSAGILVTTYAEYSVVTASDIISPSLAPVKGVTLDKRDSKPTQTSLAFTWYPPSSFDADAIMFDVLAPKPKSWAKKAKAPCIATVTVTADDFAAILAGASGSFVSRTCGDYTITISQKVSKWKVGIEVKVTGLHAATRYTINMQASDGDGNYSRVTKIAASTTKYLAPKKVGKTTYDLDSVSFAWKQSRAIPAGMDADAKREYTIGVFVGGEFIAFGSGEGDHARTVDGRAITITVTGTKAVVSGLASQKYTFGVQEFVSVGEDIAKSSIAKIRVSVR